MTDLLNWLVGAGLLGLVITLGYREWDSWRERKRERDGLLYLVDLELSYNERAISTFEKRPEDIIQPIGEPVKTGAWNDSKIRIAQLLSNKNHFRTIALFYSNLEDVMLPVMLLEAASEDVRREFVSRLLPDMSEKVREARAVVHKYISPPEEKFGLPFDLPEGSR